MVGKKPRVPLSDDELYEMCTDLTEVGVANACWLNRRVYVWTRLNCHPYSGARPAAAAAPVLPLLLRIH